MAHSPNVSGGCGRPMTLEIPPLLGENLQSGAFIPAMPLALNRERRFDERRQAALLRYYHAAGVGGLAVGVHTTQFAIRDPRHGLYEPVLRFAADELSQLGAKGFIKVAGVCGPTLRALREAETAAGLGYDLGLLSLAGLDSLSPSALIEHCRAVGEIIPIFGFYLQRAVGGLELPYSFWREFAEIESVRAIKVAAFDRYRTLDVVRAVCESGRAEDIALYTGNDDNILIDLLTPFRFHQGNRTIEKRFVGGLLGHWAVWTQEAVKIFQEIRRLEPDEIETEWLTRNQEITDCNAAFFDAAHGFRGCIPGIHEVLRRQGLLEGTWCLDPDEVLSPGQSEEIDRVCRAYPYLHDDEFVAENLDSWLR